MNNQSWLKHTAALCGVKGKMRLASSPDLLCDELKLFFHTIDEFVANAKNKSRPIIQSEVAEVLNGIGVGSASGLVVTNSHVSNAIRKAVFMRERANPKPGYVGKNYLSYKDKSPDVAFHIC